MSRSLILVFICLVCSGCSFTRNAYTVMFEEPLHFPTNLDHIRTKHSNKRLARAYLANRVQAEDTFGAWWSAAPFFAAHHGLPVSPDYADGYLEGFTDHLNYGGAGLPPLAPPRRYWRLRYANPIGREAINSWYVGFADGAADAMLSGYREERLVTFSIEAGEGVMQRDAPPRPEPEMEMLPLPIDPRLIPPDDFEGHDFEAHSEFEAPGGIELPPLLDDQTQFQQRPPEPTLAVRSALFSTAENSSSRASAARPTESPVSAVNPYREESRLARRLPAVEARTVSEPGPHTAPATPLDAQLSRPQPADALAEQKNPSPAVRAEPTSSRRRRDRPRADADTPPGTE